MQHFVNDVWNEKFSSYPAHKYQDNPYSYARLFSVSVKLDTVICIHEPRERICIWNSETQKLKGCVYYITKELFKPAMYIFLSETCKLCTFFKKKSSLSPHIISIYAPLPILMWPFWLLHNTHNNSSVRLGSERHGFKSPSTHEAYRVNLSQSFSLRLI